MSVLHYICTVLTIMVPLSLVLYTYFNIRIYVQYLWLFYLIMSQRTRNLLRDLANLMASLHLQNVPPKPVAIFHRYVHVSMVNLYNQDTLHTGPPMQTLI